MGNLESGGMAQDQSPSRTTSRGGARQAGKKISDIGQKK